MSRNVFLVILALIPVLLFRYGLTHPPHESKQVLLNHTPAVEMPHTFEPTRDLPSEQPPTPQRTRSVTPGNRMSQKDRDRSNSFNMDVPPGGVGMMGDGTGMMGNGSGMGRGMGGFAGSILGSILRAIFGGGGHMGM